MKPSRRPAGTPANLSDSIHHQLNMYALAASAAGVGMLALASPAEAKIVYTPAHRQIPVDVKVRLDLNHDRIPDFFFINDINDYGHSGAHLWVQPAKVGKSYNQIWGTMSGATNRRVASELPSGVLLSSQGKFNAGNICMASYTFISMLQSGCPWRGSTVNRYLGFKFIIRRKVHYGWARLNVDTTNWLRGGIKATLTGYAYETIPNKVIITGKTKGPDVITLDPGSLGALAAGASAHSAWRVKQTTATTH
jgi:hypothetical protein